jgi:hypothetical protein
MLGGLAAAATEYLLYRLNIVHFASPMASNLWTAVAGLAGGLAVMIATAFLTPAPDPASLKGLVYEGGSVKDPSEASLRWYNTPVFYGIVVLVIFAALNLYFF